METLTLGERLHAGEGLHTAREQNKHSKLQTG